ncbi:protein PRRC1-A-like isoform X2 [Varroa jacobsoni]|nr:protein PRRC1-A-like isoform X2 [Varroa jacobsoni]XP_022687167.1 protein PRRC1-A-like isoform X2 [Varroa jacobsoni]
MSETDEGSTGFELLDEEPPVEANSSTPLVKPALLGTRSSVAQGTLGTMQTGPMLTGVGGALQSGDLSTLQNTSTAAGAGGLAQKQMATVAAEGTAAAQVFETGVQGPVNKAGQRSQGNTTTKGTQNNDGGQGDEGGLLSPQLNTRRVWSSLQWGASLLSRVTEKATESVNKVITTLDPQMKPIIFSGGTLSIVVASDKNDKIMPIQDAFWDVFGRATVEGVKAQPSSMAAQPVGFTAGLKAAEDRVHCLRSAGDVDPDVPVVAVEGFVAELSTDRWSELACVLLQDRTRGINLALYTQATPLEDEWVIRMREDTPPDYPLSWCGFAKTIGEVASDALHCPKNAWHERHTGLPRSALIYQAARSLAFIYQQRLQAKQDELNQQLQQLAVTMAPEGCAAQGVGGGTIQDKITATPTGSSAQ